jgi:Asp-tRNA(Asn)/Glu-tRNA(Gln) amidotransferase B subunit
MAQAWEVVIGLETHAQLSTASKIFSPAPTALGAAQAYRRKTNWHGSVPSLR